MSSLFFDTGVALKLIVEEPLSAGVRTFVEKRRAPVLFSSLIEVEIQNALHALFFRGTITRVELSAARHLISDLEHRGLFRRVSLSLDKVAAETLRLAPLVTSETGCRTLDLMHISTAILLGVREFVSTDKRQLESAKLCGLQTIDLAANPG